MNSELIKSNFVEAKQLLDQFIDNEENLLTPEGPSNN